MFLENGKEEQAKKIFDKWNLDFAVIGKTTKSKKIELFFDNEQVADIPVNTLVENSPMYDRKWKKAKLPKKNKIKKEDLKNLKDYRCFKEKFYLIQMFVVKNGFGNNMITPLWEILFKNQVVTQGC